MRPRTYLIVALGLAAALVGVVVGINLRVDPYGLAAVAGQSEASGGPDAVRPGAFWRKALAVREVMPRTVILGTSRAEFGIDPLAPLFTPGDAPVLNLSLGGLTIEQIRLLLMHANATSPVKLAVIGLDMESFLFEGRTDFDPSGLEGNPETEPQWLVRLRIAASREALSASIARLLVPEAAASVPATRGKATDARAWQMSDEALRMWDGQRGMIWVAEFDNFSARLRYLFPQGSSASRWNADARRAAAMSSFGELLSYARRHDIELRMFISPIHARYLEWYRRVGWWPLFEDWKRALADAVDAQSNAAPGRPAIALWDFGGYHSLSMERVPRLGDHSTRMRWYRDTSHYSPEAGNLILERIMGAGGQEPSPLPDHRVDRATIQGDLAGVRVDAAGYRLAEPDEMANLDELVALLRHIAKR